VPLDLEPALASWREMKREDGKKLVQIARILSGWDNG
jgi:hypothetical protein